MDATSVFGRPLTPPSSRSSTAMSDDGGAAPEESTRRSALSTALHVIRTERDALTALEDLYETDSVAQDGLENAVDVISKSISCGGKVVVSGVGKSGKVGKKVVATMNSFGIKSVFLHPTEALHGDLGMIGDNDTMLIITFSGRTAEIFSILPYLPPALSLIAVTSHTSLATCTLFESRPSGQSILLPAPIPISEVQTFGVAAPTTSTTVALALTDALVIAVARQLHFDPSIAFQRFHPGGAIGAGHIAKLPLFSDNGSSVTISDSSF